MAGAAEQGDERGSVMSERPRSGSPMFAVSETGHIFSYVIFFLIYVIFFLIFGLAAGVGTNVLAALLAVIFLYGAVNAWTRRVRKASFYEDHAFLIDGIGKTRNVSYPEIKNVSLVKVFPLIEPRTQVHLTIEGQPKPLRIMANPTNKNLGKDLYSWLRERTTQQTPTTPSEVGRPTTP